MTDLILRLIGAAWLLGTAGFLLLVAISLLAAEFLPHSAYIMCPDCGGREDTDCSTCGGMGQVEVDDEYEGDEFEGDAWDRARDIEQDRRWEIAS